MIGTSITSSNSSIEKEARPTGLCVPTIGSTRAVDDSASARPSAVAVCQLDPVASITPPISSDDSSSSADPLPNTSCLMSHKRRQHGKAASRDRVGQHVGKQGG